MSRVNLTSSISCVEYSSCHHLGIQVFEQSQCDRLPETRQRKQNQQEDRLHGKLPMNVTATGCFAYGGEIGTLTGSISVRLISSLPCFPADPQSFSMGKFTLPHLTVGVY